MPNNGAAYLPTAGEGPVQQWFGVYAGTVINNHDPLGVGRLQLNVPQVLGNAVSAWAVPAGTYYALPTNGTPVSVTFLGGDPAQPLWNGPLDLNPLVESAAGPNVTYSVSAPPNPKVGDIWYQLTNGIQGPPQVWTFNSGTSTYSWVAQPSTGAYGSVGEFLVYSSNPPALGNIEASVAGVAFPDSVGNAILAGFTTYKDNHPAFSNWTATNLLNGNYTVYSAPTSAGPWTAFSGIDIAQSSSLGPTQRIVIGTSAGASVVFGDPVYGGIAATNPTGFTTPETWHTGAGLNSFTLAPTGYQRFQYRLQPDNTVEVAGCIQLPGTFSGVTFFTLPNSAYFPNAVVQWPYTTQQGLTISSDGTGAVQVDTAGNFTLRNNPSGIGSGNVLYVQGRYGLGTV